MSPAAPSVWHAWQIRDEQAFRFNEREGEDRDRFAKTLGNVARRRVTYDGLTGKAVAEWRHYC